MKHKTLVQDFMTSDPVSIGADARLVEAYRLMAEKEVRRLPVISRDELVGIVTLSDLLRSIPRLLSEEDRETRLQMADKRVRDVMTWDPIRVYADDTIQDAAELMLESQISGLPVLEGTAVVGIITESDIFRLVVESWAEE